MPVPHADVCVPEQPEEVVKPIRHDNKERAGQGSGSDQSMPDPSVSQLLCCAVL